jgi:GxxExxY protein
MAETNLPQRHRGTEIENSGNLNGITERIIGCAIEVHRQLGPGLLENVYEDALCIELQLQGLGYQRQLPVPLVYKGNPIGEYRLDLLVEDAVVVEIKAWSVMIRCSMPSC